LQSLHGDVVRENRILFFDIMRIFFVLAIVYGHITFYLLKNVNDILFMGGYLPFNLYPLGLNNLAVYGMFFVSGAVLEYTYKGLKSQKDYFKFLFKRFIRLYVIFWISLIVGIFLFIEVLNYGLFNILFEFTGFYIVLGNGSGNINIMGWFIAAIMSLYIFYPLLSKYVKKYKFIMVLLLLIISMVFRFILSTYIPIDKLYMWFPLCNIFEFGLGIYIVQNKLYPTTISDNKIIITLADLSFYIFIFHIILINAFRRFAESNPYMISTGLMYTGYYSLIMLSVLIISFIAMKIDQHIQKYIVKHLNPQLLF